MTADRLRAQKRTSGPGNRPMSRTEWLQGGPRLPGGPRYPSLRVFAPAVGAWSATAVGTYVEPPTSTDVAGASAGVIVFAAVCHWRLLAAVAFGALLGAGSSAVHVRALQHGMVPVMASRHSQVDAVARLVRDPVDTTTIGGAALTLTDATVTRVWASGRWRSADSPVLVLSYGRSGWDGLLPGQHVDVSGRLSPPRRGDDVAAVLDARGPPMLVGSPPWWQRAAGRVRLALRRACRGLPTDARGLLPGLVDGDTSAVPDALQTQMRVTGLTHLEAVSGENVSVLLAVVVALAGALGLRRRSRVLVCSVSLVAFVVLARPSPSVLRAAVMGAIVLLGMLTGRRSAALPALSTSVLVLVTIDPFLARSVGFALSVVATAGLLVIAPIWSRVLSRWMPLWLATVIAVPAAAQLACTPILVLAFGQLTPYAVPANLLAAVAVPAATVLGVVCAVVASLSVPAAVPIAWLGALPTLLITGVAHSMAALPAADLRWPGGRVPDVAAATGAVIIAGRVLRRQRVASRAILGE
jgi:competence protein ComEC